jgi:hypothetical protein
MPIAAPIEVRSARRAGLYRTLSGGGGSPFAVEKIHGIFMHPVRATVAPLGPPCA